MQSAFLIIIFLITKILQWVNGFVLARLFSSEQSFTIMVSMLIFVSAVFVFGILVKKFFPVAMKAASIVVVFALIASSLVHPSWVIIFLAGLFFYILVGAEARVLQSFFQYTHIPRFLLFILSLFPVIISYQIPQLRVAAPQIFYLISSLFAFFASYSTRMYGEGKFIMYQEAPPIWLGLFFIAGSGFLYYLSLKDTSSSELLNFVLLFYIGGAVIIYMSIDNYLRTHQNKYGESTTH